MSLRDKITSYHLMRVSGRDAEAQALKREIDKQRFADARRAMEARNFFSLVEVISNGNAAQIVSAYTKPHDGPSCLVSAIAECTNVNNAAHITYRRTALGKADISRQVVPSQLIAGAANFFGTNGTVEPFVFPMPIELYGNERLQVEFSLNPLGGGTILVGDVARLIFQGAKRQFITNSDLAYARASIAARTMPETRFLVAELEFDTALAGGIMIQPSNPEDVPQTRVSEEDILIEAIGTTLHSCYMQITDEAGSYIFSTEQVPVWGIAPAVIAGNFVSDYFYLPRPHFLKKGSRLQITGTNGYTSAAGVATVDGQINQRVVFAGRTV